jgi:aminoglycoside phosphotransferase
MGSDVAELALAIVERVGCGSIDRCAVVQTQSLRHQTALIAAPAGRFLFVKIQGRPMLSGPVDLADEIASYRFFASDRCPPAIKRSTVPLIGVTADPQSLVLGGLAAHRSLLDLVLAGSDEAAEIFGLLGTTLAELHSTPVDDAPEFSPRSHPTMTFGSISPEMLAEAPRAFSDLLRLIQADDRMNAAIGELRVTWRTDSVIHGDLKLDNVLVVDEGEAAVFLVDWELAGTGDRRWDCGAVIGSYLHTGLEAIRRQPETAARSLDSIRHFWSAYVAAREANGLPVDDTECDAAFRWAGFWLVQRVITTLPLRRRLESIDLLSMHLAANLLSSATPAIAA